MQSFFQTEKSKFFGNIAMSLTWEETLPVVIVQLEWPPSKL